MKKLIYCAAALVTALFAGSCQRELLDPVEQAGVVTFEVAIPELATKSYDDEGKNVNDLVYAVYSTEADNKEDAQNGALKFFYAVNETTGTSFDTNGKSVVTLELLNDQNYLILFWAQSNDAWVSAQGSNINLLNVTYPASMAANNKHLEAFSGVSFIKNVKGARKETVKLTRPFAQINLATTMPKAFKATLSQSEMSVTKAAASFNVAKQVASDTPTNVSFTAANVPVADFKEGYTYAGANYIFANGNVDVSYKIYTSHGDVQNIVTSVPVAKNFRTNIIGNLLTSEAEYTVELNDVWGEPETNIELWDGKTVSIPTVSAENKNVYVISHPNELAWLAAAVNGTLEEDYTRSIVAANDFDGKTFILTKDVDLANCEWSPIGSNGNIFKGTFDGQSHTVKNLVVNGDSESDKGLFGVTHNGEIKNLIVENAKVSGRLNVGVVAGQPYTSKYTNITVKGHVEVNGMAYVGGVGGKNAYADWTNVTVNVDETSYVKANSVENGTAYRTYVGGVVGFNGEGEHKFSNITSNINVEGTTCDVGGLFGIAHYGNQFENCLCTGKVTITTDEVENALEMGGIAGVWNNGGQDVVFTNCKFEGELLTPNITEEFDFYYGGLIGNPYSPDGKGKLIIDGATCVHDAASLKAALEANTENIVVGANIQTTEGFTATGDNITLNLGGYTISGTDDSTGSFGLITNKGKLTVEGPGSMTLTATNDREWNAYSSVISNNPGGNLTVDGGVVIEHLGGTAMAYGIDNLTNGKGTSAVTTIKNATVKSVYRAVRQFLNGVEATNELYVEADAVIEGTNKSVWMQDPSANPNTGKLVVAEGAQLKGDVYLFVCAGSTEWPVEVSIANAAFVEGSTVITGNVPAGLAVENVDGTWTLVKTYEEIKEGDTVTGYKVKSAAGLKAVAVKIAENPTLDIVIDADIDLPNEYFAPIGYNPETGNSVEFQGTFDGQGYSIKGLRQSTLDGSYTQSVGLFAKVKNATIKNVVLEDFVTAKYGAEAGAIASIASGDCVFEDITVKNGSIVSYNNDTAPIIGWANVGNFTLKDITVGSDVVIYSLWDSYDTTLGGLIGTLKSPSTVHIENANISCVLNAFNDVCGNYQWYAYRRTGMVVGNMSETKDVDGRTVPDPEAAGVTCENVVVTYGDWMNYHYCEFEANGAPSYAKEGQWKFSRVEGQEWGRESNIDTDNCQHDTDESHNILLPVDQLFGGGQGVYGLREYEGVTVNYPASYRREVSSAAALTEALGKGVSVILDTDIDFGSTQLAITGENQVVDLGGHALTTANNWGGISLKNGATIKNGTITHAGTTAAIKAFNGSSVENVTINATCTTADKTVTGIAVQQGATVESIKNVTINGVSQGIEVGYQATVGLIENAVVNESNNGTAKGIGLVINGGKVGKAKDCTFKGETYGITLHLKGVFAAGLELENCKVEGTTASISAWDEKGISNTSGSLVLTYDAATTLTGPFVWDFEEECQSVVTLNRPQ